MTAVTGKQADSAIRTRVTSGPTATTSPAPSEIGMRGGFDGYMIMPAANSQFAIVQSDGARKAPVKDRDALPAPENRCRSGENKRTLSFGLPPYPCGSKSPLRSLIDSRLVRVRFKPRGAASAWLLSGAHATTTKTLLVDPCAPAPAKDSTHWLRSRPWVGGCFVDLLNLGNPFEKIFLGIFKVTKKHIAGTVPAGSVYTLDAPIAHLDNRLQQLRAPSNVKGGVLKASPRERDESERVMIRVTPQECHEFRSRIGHAHSEDSDVEILLFAQVARI